jgi:hypothetical protein
VKKKTVSLRKILNSVLPTQVGVFENQSACKIKKAGRNCVFVSTTHSLCCGRLKETKEEGKQQRRRMKKFDWTVEFIKQNVTT